MCISQGDPRGAPVVKARCWWLFSMGHSLLIISRCDFCDPSVQFRGVRRRRSFVSRHMQMGSGVRADLIILIFLSTAGWENKAMRGEQACFES